MKPQDIMEDWRAWLIDSGVSPDVAVKLMRKGYRWCYFLWDAVHA